MRRTKLDFMGAACEFFAYFLSIQKVVHYFGACLKQCGSTNQKSADYLPAPGKGVDPFFFFDKLGI